MMRWFWLHKARVEAEKAWAWLRKDDYQRLAAELQDALLLGWNKAIKEDIAQAIAALKNPGKFSETELQELVSAVCDRLGLKFSNQQAAPLLEIQTASYGLGMQEVIRVKPTFQLIDKQALETLQRHGVYWVKTYFDVQLKEQVQRIGARVIEEGLDRVAAGELFQQAFEEQLGTYGARYWRGFSNHVVTRSRELGRVEGYVRAGIEYLEVRAVLDRRTTRICKEMHGRIIKVSRAVELRDKLINAENPEQVKQIAPWRKPEEVAEVPTEKLPTGLSLPPYHFNCRTRTVSASAVEDIEEIDIEAADAGTRLNASLRAAVNNQQQLKRAALRKLVNRSLGADFPDAARWLARNPGIDSVAQLDQALRELIQGPGRSIFLHLRADAESWIVYHDGVRAATVSVLDNRVGGVFLLPDEQMLRELLLRDTGKLVLQKKGWNISKGGKMKPISEQEIFEITFESWTRHVEDLLKEDDPFWQDYLLLARSNLERYLQRHPEALSERQKKQLRQADDWLTAHGAEPAVLEAVRRIPSFVRAGFWWEDEEKLKERAHEAAKSPAE